jgi:para-aminobenzoate synthetase/4-amino-4-deoxychorismate lyase
VEPHPGLWHLVSTVRAELRDDATDAGLLRAAFPPGSVTGAPKVQALHVIHALEGTGREAYTGAIGLASPVAGLHLNVAIRTFEVRGGRIWLGCGGGVVADSDPDGELAEALAKARPLVEALGGRVAAPRPWRPRPLPPLLVGPRPDPAHGLLETVRVVDGVPRHLERHLRRLRASARALGLPVPRLPELPAGAPGVQRLRLRLAPDGEVGAELLDAGGPPAPVALAPVLLPGGLGAHKWADRARLPPRGLVVDADGAVLEATWASVWLVEGDRLVTPPADGRLLPGVTRERVLERGGLAGRAADVEPVDLDRLRRADAVLLTSSIGLVTAVGDAAEPLAAAARAELAGTVATMPSTSAGVLLFRRRDEVEVLLVHPGGPFWAKKDEGAWSIPKGELEDGEAPRDRALLEFEEETGTRLDPATMLHELGSIRQRGGKTVVAFAAEGDLDAGAVTSNTFEIEWPPRSGRRQAFPEVDRAAWFGLEEARRRINPAQAELLKRLPG